ncbi:MAG: aromatic ring-hydroxylating dioxygenase subunit alpha [Acidimicrobiales bacterium]
MAPISHRKPLDPGPSTTCTDIAVLDQWHPIASVAESPAGVPGSTTLLGVDIGYLVEGDGSASAWVSDSRVQLPTLTRYGYVWASLGSPPDDLFEVAEYDEPDRRNVHGATVGIHCSAPRAVENFLDMGHFPYVHTDYLGEEPHTEVAEYEVEIDAATGDIWAKECVFWQPMAAASAEGGQMVDYLYRVPHPYCTVLYKSSPADESRMDVVCLFNQPLSEDMIHGHMFVSYIDAEHSEAELRRFSQTIFAQDKPILENQYPKRLPLDPRAETPIRADKVAIAYRRYLSELGVTYGVIPVEGNSSPVTATA